MKTDLVRVALLVGFLLCSGCGLKPAQDYLVIGTLSVTPSLQSVVTQAQRRGSLELVMTARLGPDVADVVVQRRWKNPTFPLQFGLGKGRLPEFESQELYITAKLVLPQVGALVGFSSAPIPAGTEFVELAIDRQEGDPQNANLPGYPRGGFESKSVREEATPPGAQEFSPGARVFSGRVEVAKAYQEALRGLRLFVIARERIDRGAPELILYFDNNDYPQSFALHQAHRIQLQAGQAADAMKAANDDPILTPKFIVAQIDLDGSVDTKDDLFSIATEAQVEVGSENIVLRFPEAELQRLLKMKSERAALQGTKMPSGHGGAGAHGGSGSHGSVTQGGSGSHGAVTPGAGHGHPEGKPKVELGGVLVAGELSLPAALAQRAEGAELWFSIRDPESGKMVDTYRAELSEFPINFSLENGAGMMSMAFAADQGFIVKAILTTDGLMSKNALVAYSSAVTAATKGLKLELAEQAQEDGAK